MSRNSWNDSNISSIKTDAGITADPKVMSEAFNDYVAEMGSSLADQLLNLTKTYTDFVKPVVVDSSYNQLLCPRCLTH